MKKQAADSLLLESLVSTTSPESLAKGYIRNCKTEAESPKTVSGYEMALRNFIWYYKQNDFPEIQRLTAVDNRHFLWYLASESHRWDSTGPAAKRQATSTTVNGYFRALRTFFNWLELEEERQINKDKPAYTEEECRERLNYYLSHIPYKLLKMRYSSFTPYFGHLKRLGWVKGTNTPLLNHRSFGFPRLALSGGDPPD